MPTSHPVANLLIVDDEPLIRDSLAEFLGQEGFAVVACGSAEEALVTARARCFDVALCDVQLPGLSGVELLERLHQISPSTLVLLITAYGTMDNAVAAFRRGAAGSASITRRSVSSTIVPRNGGRPVSSS